MTQMIKVIIMPVLTLALLLLFSVGLLLAEYGLERLVVRPVTVRMTKAPVVRPGRR